MTLSPQVFRDAAELILADTEKPLGCCFAIDYITDWEGDAYSYYFYTLFGSTPHIDYWWDDPPYWGKDPDRHLQRELALLFAAEILESET